MGKKLDKSFRAFAITLAFILAVLVAGCSVHNGNQGILRLSGEINDMFETHQVKDEYNYYYTGRDARPDAILGVDKKYKLRSSLWKPVELTSGQLGQWIDMMTDHRGFSIRTYGAEVLGPGNEPIGIWYSPWSWTTVRLVGNDEVVIHTPTGEPFYPKMGVTFRGKKDW